MLNCYLVVLNFLIIIDGILSYVVLISSTYHLRLYYYVEKGRIWQFSCDTLLNSDLLMRCLLGCVVFYLNLEESQSSNYILEKNILGSVGKDMIPDKSIDMHPEGIIIIFMPFG